MDLGRTEDFEQRELKHQAKTLEELKEDLEYRFNLFRHLYDKDLNGKDWVEEILRNFEKV